MTAILLAGRSGAAFAAEIGTMKVNEELNALTTMGFSRNRAHLVVGHASIGHGARIRAPGTASARTRGESAKSAAGSVHHAAGSSPAAASSRSTPSRRNLALISVRISSPAAKSTVELERGDGDRLRGRGPEAHLDPLGVDVEAGDVVEPRRFEVGVELAVEHAQHVAVELRGHARGVVVGGDEAVDVLHQVGAEQEGVAGCERGGQVGEERGARPPGARLPIVLPRNATTRVPPVGRSARWCSKSPTTAWTRDARVLRDTAAAASRRVCSLTSNGTKRSRVPASRSASSRIRVFSDVPGAQLHQRVGLGQLGDVARVGEQDAAFGAGRVVLGEAGDLVEQLAPAVVVEPLRRQRLRHRAEAFADVGGQRARDLLGLQVHVDEDVRGHGAPFTAQSCAFRGPSS